MQSKPDGSYGLQAETASKPFTCSPLPPVCGSGSSLPYSGRMWTSNPDEPRCASSAPNRPPRAVPSSPRPRTVRAAPSCSHGHHPKLVQELLGHASVALTLDRYSHVLPGMGDQTAAAMEATLS